MPAALPNLCSEHVDIPVRIVNNFRGHLSSSRPLKVASINALYQLVQKDALAMSKIGGDRLVEDLFWYSRRRFLCGRSKKCHY